MYGISRLRSRARGWSGVVSAYWYTLGKADDTDPTFWADFVNNRYAAITNPLRTIASNNRIFSAQDRNSTRDSAVIRTHYVITDSTNLQFMINNWVMSAGGTINGQPFDILDMSVDIGGTVVPLTFGGNRGYSVAAGENLFADKLVPSDFSLSSFDMGTIVWLKGRIKLAAVNTYLVENHHRSAGELAGNQFAWYLDGDTVVSSTDTSGMYTAISGSALYSRAFLFAPILLGNPIVDYSVGLVGDSIGAGLTDANFGAAGGGFFHRAAYGDGSTDVIATINACVGGRNSDDYIGDTNMQFIYKYCKHWGYQHAANDIGSTTTYSQQKTRFDTLISELKAGGAINTFAVPPFARTTSTDSFSSAVNQTYLNAGWQPDGVADQIEAYEYAQVGVSIDAILPTTVVRDTTETRKWKTNGIAQRWTGDGLHCKEQANIDLAVAHYLPLRSFNSVDTRVFGTRQFNDIFTFTRSTTATYFDANGVMQTAAINEPRFDHDPVTLEPLGLMVEEQRTNLVLNSATGVNQTVSVGPKKHSLSFYGTGTVTLSGTHSATVVGTGSYPVRTVYNFNTTAGSLNLAFVGDVQYVQLEQEGSGMFPTSYIPTTSSAVTRGAEFIDSTASNSVPPSNWLTQGIGTLFTSNERFEGQSPTNVALFQLSDGGGNNTISLNGPSDSRARLTVKVSGSTQADIDSGESVPSPAKAAGAYNTNDFALYINGVAKGTDTSGTVPNPLTDIDTNAVKALGGRIKEWRYYPIRVSNSELERITT